MVRTFLAQPIGDPRGLVFASATARGRFAHGPLAVRVARSTTALQRLSGRFTRSCGCITGGVGRDIASCRAAIHLSQGCDSTKGRDARRGQQRDKSDAGLARSVYSFGGDMSLDSRTRRLEPPSACSITADNGTIAIFTSASSLGSFRSVERRPSGSRAMRHLRWYSRGYQSSYPTCTESARFCRAPL